VVAESQPRKSSLSLKGSPTSEHQSSP
jgi:hypothetical protein